MILLNKFDIRIKKIKRLQIGTTLVELLIYLGLVTILLGMLTQIFVSILDVQLSSEATSSVAFDSRYIVSRLTYDIQRADSITVPVAYGSESDNLQMMINGISYSYGLVSGDLVLTRASASSQLNSYDTSISGLGFKKIGNVGGNETVQVIFTTTSQGIVNGENETKTLQTTISTR